MKALARLGFSVRVRVRVRISPSPLKTDDARATSLQTWQIQLDVHQLISPIGRETHLASSAGCGSLLVRMTTELCFLASALYTCFVLVRTHQQYIDIRKRLEVTMNA